MAIDPQILVSITGQHPARRMDFDTLYSGLMAEVAAGNVSTVQGPDGLVLFSYTIDCQFGNKWNVFSLIARGLILDPANKQVVATPFPKFFNHGELPVHFPNGKVSTYTPDGPFTVTEKMDGSLGIIFNYKGKVYACTRGSFQSDQAQWAKAQLERNIETIHRKNDRMRIGMPIEGYTYLVEIIYPENRIVVPYDFSGLVLLAIYDPKGHELLGDDLMMEANAMALRQAATHSFNSLDEMIEAAKGLPCYKEGWVIRFDNGYRVKIKGDEYCRVHRLVSNVTPNRVWEVMVNGDDVEQIRKQLPEELRTDFDNIVAIYDEKLAKLMTEVRFAYEETKHLSDKDCGLLLVQRFPDKDSVPRNFTFPARKSDFFTQVKIGGSPLRRKAFKTFLPKSNRLAGYTPSTAMNRFSSADES
jgi:RNA ligase